jgi:cobalt-zinc-cadmium efflux system membrane fusion protein
MNISKRLSCAWAVLALAMSCDKPKPQEKPAPPQTAAPEAPTSVAMSPDAVAAAGVTTAPVVQSTVVVHDELPGTIEAPRDALVIVNTRAAGVVEALDFDVGDRVKAGQRLATIRSLELAEAQAAYRRGLIAEQYAATALERSEMLRREGVISQRRSEADQLAARESRLGLEETSERVRILGGTLANATGVTSITSPIAGVIATRSANRGEAVANNSALYTVVDVSKVVVQLRALGGTQIEPDTEVHFSVDALPGRTFAATTKSASDVIDPETRRFLVRCSVDNRDGVLKPGMFLTAKVPRPIVRALAIPEPAIQVMQSGPAVFVAHEGGRFERRDVVVGPHSDGQVVIEKGLVEGETVVVQGAFWVRTQLQKSELEE